MTKLNNLFRSGSTQSDDPFPDPHPETVQVDPLSLQLAEAGPITLAVAAFFKEMHSVTATKSGPVNPGRLSQRNITFNVKEYSYFCLYESLKYSRFIVLAKRYFCNYSEFYYTISCLEIKHFLVDFSCTIMQCMNDAGVSLFSIK